MNKGIIVGVGLACLVLITVETLDFFQTKKELLQLQIEETKLSVKLLKMQLKQQ